MFKGHAIRAELTKARDMATTARDAMTPLGAGEGVPEAVFDRIEASIFGLLLAYKKAIEFNIESKREIEKIVWRVITLEKKLESIELLPDAITEPINDPFLRAEIEKVWHDYGMKKF
jgi:hypothetical protein